LLFSKYNIDAKKKYIIFKCDEVYDERFFENKLAFKELTNYCYLNRVNLGEHGFYKTPYVHFDLKTEKGSPFYYYVFGGCIAQAEIDVLTGNSKILKTYILHDVGRSLNRETDIGQIAGAFMQGLGYCLMEEDQFDANGKYLANSPSKYKIPTVHDMPDVFDIQLFEHDCKRSSVLNSKGIGEPPFLYGEACYFAVKDAVEAITNHGKDIKLPFPATPEAVLMAIDLIYQN
jgi:xanthine dehydrogenase molybdopterin-binding subunit B